MGEIRYINGWECPICFDLHPTERKAKNCLKECLKDCNGKVKESEKKIVLLRGWECIDCLKIHSRKLVAEDCCHPNYPQEKDKPGEYNVIGNWNKKKAKTKDGEKK